jgi:hypothetical protein
MRHTYTHSVPMRFNSFFFKHHHLLLYCTHNNTLFCSKQIANLHCQPHCYRDLYSSMLCILSPYCDDTRGLSLYFLAIVTVHHASLITHIYSYMTTYGMEDIIYAANMNQILIPTLQSKRIHYHSSSWWTLPPAGFTNLPTNNVKSVSFL